MTLHRRDLLAFAGASVLPALTTGIKKVPVRASPPGRDWKALAENLGGELVLPGHSDYDRARLLYNPRFDATCPAAIAYCQSPSDVRECLSFARRSSAGISVRSGGHNYAGWSSGSGLIIDVSRLNAISVDPASRTASIGSGAKLITVYAGLSAHGVTIPAGSCATVGIAGLTLGGGNGVTSRAYGLTCDNLRSVTLVAANGALLTCDKDREPDLFWACQGGGGGNFGVVTSFTFQTHPTRTITRLTLEWPWRVAAKVVQSWQAWAPNAPDEVWSYCQVRTDSNDPGPRVRVLIVFLGSEGDLEPMLDALIGGAGEEPIRTVATESHLQSMLSLAGCSQWPVDQCELTHQGAEGKLSREAFFAKSDFFGTPLSTDAIGTILRSIEDGRKIPDLAHARITFDSFGGAISRVNPNETAFVHRDALFNAQYLAFWKEGSPIEVEQRCMAWLRSFHGAMRPYANGGAYVNYIDPDLQNWPRAYYGSGYERLVRVKARYDPEGVFKLPQGVPSS